jgi:D-cysteine desulfhydrase family pyridoxal phosphate-dependent enzyme
MIDTIERIQLAQLPTPLEEAPRLAKHLGLSTLFIKRDDMTGLALGGNKARKLEYDFADVLRKKCDTVVTVGGVQSNHARMTAAAARRVGIDVKLVLGGPDFTEYQGNLLLEVLLGAEVRFLENDDDNDHLTAAMDEWVRELASAGRRPYAIPVGGSTGLGAIGYVRAMRELASQLPAPGGPVQVILAVGSCGTFAGAILGAQLFLPRARMIGISVSRTSAEIALRTREIMAESARILGAAPGGAAVESYDRYFQAYGVPTEQGKEAIIAAARLEGLLLDPVYTGKAMAGLMDLVCTGTLEKDIPTVFLHTGGTPILFSFEKEFRALAAFTKR